MSPYTHTHTHTQTMNVYYPFPRYATGPGRGEEGAGESETCARRSLVGHWASHTHLHSRPGRNRANGPTALIPVSPSPTSLSFP